ncbi:MAG: histidine kinase dimerization/phosphoacceptor domain -containing protein [Coleofasciculus sp. C1-SOL-03]|uniref:histidine kinase dimerization/phosphoacceptor domain -containing protein n=1 Tax=Coleofasciculus sp. C1-SOL-03 TaxID=3069522 RepID=UPI0032F229ED
MSVDQPSNSHLEVNSSHPTHITALGQELIELRRQVSRQTLLNQIVQAMRGTLVLEDILQTTVDQLHETLNVSRCLIFRPDDESQMRAHHVSEATAQRKSILGVYCDFYQYHHQELSQGQPVVVPQITPNFPDVLIKAAQDCEIRAILIVPLLYQNSYMGGISLHQCDQTREWNREDIEFVQAIANHCAIAIHQAQLYAKLQRELRERQQVEEALRQSETRFRTVLKHAPLVVFNQDQELRYTWAYNVVPDDDVDAILGKTDSELLAPQEAQPLISIKQRVLTSGIGMRAEVSLTINGKLRYYDLTVEPLRNSIGDIEGITCAAMDISDRKHIEEQLKISLQQKEVLFQEIHHRVKNNLQLVSSLLDLQSQQIDDPEIFALFQASQSRIKSMALIHEELYQFEHLEGINFINYIENLTYHLIQTYAIHPESIILQLNIDQRVNFDLSTAIYCGLILNELISNALKHAFTGNSHKGHIWIDIYSKDTEYKKIQLIVGNNKPTPTELIDFNSPKSLGLQLVHALVAQLQGKLEIKKTNNTVFEIEFSPKNI